MTSQTTTDPAATALAVIRRIAAELGVRDHQVAAAVDLLDGGATVPFIARYRKEATGTLDDAQLRTLEERLRYLRELAERRAAILASVAEQGKLTDELAAQINNADTKARLEDLYLPYKPKRRTRAQIARENGLEPLADLLLNEPENDPNQAAASYLTENVPDAAAALDGARAILVERFAEDADLIGQLRERMWSQGRLQAKVREGKQDEGRKYSDYFDFAEPFGRLKAHRVLAMFRAEKEEVLDLTLDPAGDAGEGAGGRGEGAGGRGEGYERLIAERFGVEDRGRPADKWLADTVSWAWRTRILVHLGIDLRMRLCRRPKPRPSTSSPPTCATCCSPPRPASAPRWAWTPASAPASRSQSSTRPARWWPRTRSTRTSRSTSGTNRCTSSPAWPGSTTSS